MQKKRIFRQDFIPLEKEYKFTRGDVATIVKENKQTVEIEVAEKHYKLPYRDFIVLTKRDELHL
ncbi:MAG: hypothetical protein U5K00_23570 [Melioribacteraceae bacterium]|nr:hypothetical protein [Melioribacteraceae bacterium]